MALASIGKVSGAGGRNFDHAVDVEGISALTDHVLAMETGTTTRPAMDDILPMVLRHLNSLLDTGLGQVGDGEARALRHTALSLIERGSRPNDETPAFGVFIHLHETALITRRLLCIYAQREGLNLP
ncbi:hypothetical protein [Streptomyces sp. NPDC049881]|uniref:hypothetical protein n=1 Tax=Streptomyces sp. NPDC049881 TaxID=3155778 RepID=UPI00341EEA10